MNYLELCKRMRQEAGISGTGPANITSATGEMGRIVDWVEQAWTEIQGLRPDWRFLLTQASLTANIGSNEVGLPADYRKQVQLYLTDNSVKHKLTYLDYNDFLMVYGGTVFQSQKPTVWTVNGNSIKFNALSDAAYPLTLDYYTQPVVLSDAADVPAIDTHLHMIIVFRALQYYAAYENAPEVMGQAKTEYRRLLMLLEDTSLPIVEVGAPLA